MNKFSWIKTLHANNAEDEQLKPRDYALINDDDNINVKDLVTIKNTKDRLRRELQLRNYGEVPTHIAKKTVIEDYDASFSWRSLYLKLCFEDAIEKLPFH